MKTLLFTCLFLAACTASHSVLLCPHVTFYDSADQAKLANALQKLPNDSPIWPMALDWEKMRASAKACTAH
jgi:hypothetical protein